LAFYSAIILHRCTAAIMSRHQPQPKPQAPCHPTTITPAQVLPSFPRIRQQNLNVLYGDHGMDKSRMGHVDTHIKHLVDTINQNPNYVTLSSCSGRIVLFHPTVHVQHEKETTDRNVLEKDNEDYIVERTVPVQEMADANEIPIENSNSGKGSTGSWLFVSHDVVMDPVTSIVPFFFPKESSTGTSDDTDSIERVATDVSPNQEDQICYFKFEPMLLHVAACNLEAGQLLLQLALQNGLRESGMIITSQRVTVAFRTHSLALSIPLSLHPDHVFFPKSTKYILSLTNELNRRLILNLQLIQKVFMSFEQAFVAVSYPPITQQISNATTVHDNTNGAPSVESLTITTHPQLALPSLNLYGHTTVISTTMVGTVTTFELLVFGGYGSGPTLQRPLGHQTKMRSSNVYRLRQVPRGSSMEQIQWNSHWESVDLVSNDWNASTNDELQKMLLPSNDSEISILIKVKRMIWDGRVHATAINLTTILGHGAIFNGHFANTTHVLLFGGRYGPDKPTNDLVLFEYISDVSPPRATAFHPLDVRGTVPTPRWGHTLTALLSSSCDKDIISLNAKAEIPIAVLIGGRHTSGTNIDTLYVLSVIPSSADNIHHDTVNNIEYHFLWESVRVGTENDYYQFQRFYHTATAIDEENRIFIFGGMFHADNLLEAFEYCDESSGNDEIEPTLALLLTMTRRSRKNVEDSKESYSCTFDAMNLPHTSYRFGHAAICIPVVLKPEPLPICSQTKHQSGAILLLGGVLSPKISNTGSGGPSENSSFVDCVQFEMRNGQLMVNTNAIEIHFLDVGKKPCASFDPGVLIYHSCLALPTTSIANDSLSQIEIVTVGGGVSGFAFQDLLAPSHHLLFAWNTGNRNTSTTFGDDVPQNLKGGQRSSVASLETHNVLSSTRRTIDLQQPCDVVYVLKQNAKVVKSYLEKLQYIHKLYRITNIDTNGITQWSGTTPPLHTLNDLPPENCVALPIAPQCIDPLKSAIELDSTTVLSTISLIVGFGKQSCLPSTRMYARGSDLG
jgi:tRNA(Phe) wybutosine-synthesizing methylase Tyw3